ncbi:uncharacterized protein PAC_05444 [Phialocephala subalpina]|uniref:DUF3500 domain-containing protein n=1 Tax=Phialocephala subalpina TaxID=576137 RepID=A0A1L7WS00_9HELO|nr:uncharacterized protein PAC_05444 [Phialocephala subalpina]
MHRSINPPVFSYILIFHCCNSTGHPRTAGLDDIDIYAYSKDIINKPKPKQLFGPWLDLLKQPFTGITTDGIRREGLYDLADEGAPTQEMVAAAKLVQDCLSSEEKRKACYDIDAEEWRQWCNPEFVFLDTGIRLTVLPQQKIDLVLGLLKASLSPSGYEKAVGSMRTNHFLGEIVHAKSILNQHSYHFSLFGEPSETKPWGFSFFGHHLCLNIFVLGKQMTVSPAFVGAEPNVIDSGPWQGLTLLTMEASSALELMQSLSPELQQKAQIYKKMHDPAMPEGRWHPADQRHLGGAFQDNRVIPYEGIAVVDMTKGQQEKLLSVVATFLNILPSEPFKARMRQIESYLSETYFCWIGGFGDEDPFYYRIQGPVICLEFDHHAGVFLLNAEPAKCHIHTILRTPNGNDYGKEWLRLFRGGDKVGNST